MSDAPENLTAMQAWSEKKPESLHKGQLLLWRTKHIRHGCAMRMTGLVLETPNGWTETKHLLPPMTCWDGYRHIIPDDLEWSFDVPERISEIAFTNQTAYKVHQLVSVDGIELKPCPFSGQPATWDSRGGFIGSMAHQHEQFSAGGSLRTGYFDSPKQCAEVWNWRVDNLKDGVKLAGLTGGQGDE